jgi:hypothetical protein
MLKARSDFSQIKPGHMFNDFSIHRYSSSKADRMDAPNRAEVERNQSNLVALVGGQCARLMVVTSLIF